MSEFKFLTTRVAGVKFTYERTLTGKKSDKHYAEGLLQKSMDEVSGRIKFNKDLSELFIEVVDSGQQMLDDADMKYRWFNNNMYFF